MNDPAGGGREAPLHDTLPTVAGRARPVAVGDRATVVGAADQPTTVGVGEHPTVVGGPERPRALDASEPHRIEGVDQDEAHAAAMFAQADAPDRYERGPLLGMGGMGEVVAKADRATGRTVAVKRVRTELATPTLLRRFAREARIQAQLEHPSIVPVYDVGVDADGAQYFTMKRIRGHSLSHVIERLRFGDAEMTARFTRRRLLTVLSQVALTVEYAHRRGVIHRDLKPSNVMLGDLGEVYVLDWGLADVIGSDGTPTVDLSGPATVPELSRDLLDSPALPETGTGTMLGTPGYAGPEMIDRSVGPVDTRADVYALGCVLYELLTLERVHQGTSLGQILSSSLDTDGAHPGQRVAEIPPELDALCYQATRRDPNARLPSAAALARAIDAYLDGDRDLVERRRMADVHAEAAGVALDRRAAGDHATALREVTTALALDPGHERARAMLVRTLTEPSAEAEAGAEAAQAVHTERSLRRAAIGAMFASSTFALYLPIVLWMGIRSWFDLGMIAIGVVTTIGTTYLSFRSRLTGDLPMWHLAVSSIGLASGAVVISPIVLLPALAIGTGVGYIAIFGRRVPLLIAVMLGIVLVPLALELAGVMPASIRFVDDSIVLVPRMVAFPRVPTLVFIVVSHVVIIVTALYYVWRLRRTAAAAERRLAIQAWQLAQLVPHEHRELLTDARPAPDAATPPRPA